MRPGMDLNSSRARQAHMALKLRPAWLRGVFAVVMLALALSGVWLAWQKIPYGAVVAAFAAWPLMVLVWYEWQLKILPPERAETVDALLDAELLGRLKPGASPKQLAEIAAKTSAGGFFAARLGIGPDFMGSLSSQDSADAEAVWQAAFRLQKASNASVISAAVLYGALIEQLQGRDKMLANLQLTYDDVQRGVAWYHHLQNLVASYRTRRLGGGIGRDLSFGYTLLLSRFALNVSRQVEGGMLTRELEGHREVLKQIMNQLSSGGRKNAVLVGPVGVGKTTLVYSLAEQLVTAGAKVPKNLRYLQVMALDPASLIAQARGRGELENLVQQLMVEAHRAKNVILFFDNAELFFSDQTGAVDLRNVLLPVIEAGGLRMILSMDEQQWLKLSRATPSLTQQLSPLRVGPLGEADTFLVCEDQVINYEFRAKVTYMYQAFKTAYRLGQRYVPDQAMPGQALAVLEAAAQYAQNGLVTAASVEQAVEKRFGVKVASASHTDERQTLLNLEQLLHTRMIGQKRAVGVVANALRRARSGVRNQNRPIGSFLFLGPTGVGKSELAKALAAVYFNGEDRLVRIDLNEFGQASDANRLIADGGTDPRSLCAQILKQPYSVVLLDEIEKAHPNVLNTLLQMLDEGILRDIANRDVSFRDAVVIATSNAGADRIRQYVASGYPPEQFEKQFMDELIESNQFKPEFLNRFDETVVFTPLTAEELLAVVDLMLTSVNETLVGQQVSVQVADDAKRRLVEVGNDPRLGARPMRRIVQRTVENIVAKRLLEGKVAPGQVIELSLQDIEEAMQQ